MANTRPGPAGATHRRAATGIRALASTALAMMLLAVPYPAAMAQSYPSQTIKVITNVGVGGTFDIFMRALGEELQKALGKPVVIEPRPGGNFIIAGRACAESAPDGHTICALSGETLVYSEFLTRKLPFDPRKDLVPVTNLFFNTQLLVVSADLGVGTLDDLVRVAKARPKSLAYMAPAIPHRVFLERFNKQHGTDIVSVPFKGGGEAITSMLNGTTPIIFLGGANFAPYIAQGTMVGLAVDGDSRSPLFPEVPTLRELGYKEKLPRVYLSLVVPARTPSLIIQQVYSSVARIMAETVFRQRHLIERGLEPVVDSPAQFARFLDEDRLACEAIVKEAGLSPQ